MNNKKKQVAYSLIMIFFVLMMMEGLASVYYFQRGNFDRPLAIVQLVDGLKNRMTKLGILQSEKSGYYVNDDRFGWLAKKDTQFSPDYCGSTVKYTMDPNGARAIPKPKDPVGQIIFIGGSFTFGHCVNDNETYPYILASEYWDKWEVQNMAVSGFGTHQAYMRLLDSIKSDRAPSMVIYGMIPYHIQRNYLDRDWLNSITPRKLPHFELMNGELVFKGTVAISSGIESGPELRMKELEMTSAYLNAMQKICAENNIPFIVIALPVQIPIHNYPPPVIFTLYKSKILFLDLGTLEYEGISAREGHPNPTTYRRIAKAIANSFVSDKLLTLTTAVQ